MLFEIIIVILVLKILVFAVRHAETCSVETCSCLTGRSIADVYASW